jgi:hypothetical protein
MPIRSQHTGAGLMVAASVLGGVMLLSACSKTAVNQTGGNYRPECPVDSIVIRDTSEQKVRLVSFTQLAISGPTTLVPEFNDCQRFPIGAGPVYGPLVGIFARESLNHAIAQLLDLAHQGASARAVSIGLILSWDGDYSHLGIQTGFNCLYMWATIQKDSTLLSAFMLPTKVERACLENLAPEPLPTGATKLRVYRRQPDPAYGVGDYPEVARWDWDGVAHREYIVIGCRDAWCDIASEPLQPSMSYNKPTLPLPARRVLQIKGWYDEQRLADKAVIGPGLEASPVTGTFYPAPNLAQLAEGDFTGTKWPTVAFAAIRGPMPNYVKKLNFEEGSLAADRLNQVALCKGTQADCGIPSADQVQVCANGADPWWAKITSVSGKIAYRCVIRRLHPGVIIPGIVRWRWATEDERGWIACPGGCCEVVGKT